jgi:hypothetical protein
MDSSLRRGHRICSRTAETDLAARQNSSLAHQLRSGSTPEQRTPNGRALVADAVEERRPGSCKRSPLRSYGTPGGNERMYRSHPRTRPRRADRIESRLRAEEASIERSRDGTATPFNRPHEHADVSQRYGPHPCRHQRQAARGHRHLDDQPAPWSPAAGLGLDRDLVPPTLTEMRPGASGAASQIHACAAGGMSRRFDAGAARYVPPLPLAPVLSRRDWKDACLSPSVPGTACH